MATTPIVIPERAPEPSIAELRAMVADEPVVTEKSAPEAKSEPAEPAEVAEPVKQERQRGADGKFLKAEPGDETEIQEPEKEAEDTPLPANVQKRIAKEVEKQAKIDREIAEHVSRTKAKQAELEKLKSAESGPEPATNTELADDEEPVEPAFGTEGQTWADYQAAMKEFRKQHDTWILQRAERLADNKWIERQRQEKFDRTMAEGKKAHGEGFDDMRVRVVETAPESLQIEIGQMEDWPSMVAYLGHPDNAAKLESLSNLFNQNPSAAIRELGRIEDRLKAPATKEPEKVKATATAILPEPPARVGGGAAATPKTNFEKAEMRTFKREIQPFL